MVRQLNELIPSESYSVNLDKSASSSSLVSVSPNVSAGSSREIGESVHKPTLKRCNSSGTRTMLIQLDFVKSILTINPCMVSYIESYQRKSNIISIFLELQFVLAATGRR